MTRMGLMQNAKCKTKNLYPEIRGPLPLVAAGRAEFYAVKILLELHDSTLLHYGGLGNSHLPELGLVLDREMRNLYSSGGVFS